MILKYYDPDMFKALRKANNISGKDLANVCYMTRQTVSNYDNGKVSKPNMILLTYALDSILEEKKKKGEKVYEINY